jgi:predicted nucleic acid-binding protein
MSDRFIYLDSSAVAKLVISEPETRPLRAHLKRSGRSISAALVVTEVLRAAARVSPTHLANAREILDAISLIELDQALLQRAAELPPPEMRTLDAIHVAAALLLADNLAEFVTYDRRLETAARAWGLRVVSPA